MELNAADGLTVGTVALTQSPHIDCDTVTVTSSDSRRVRVRAVFVPPTLQIPANLQ